MKVVALDSQLTTHQLRPSSERTVLARDNPHLFPLMIRMCPNLFYSVFSSSNREAFGSFRSLELAGCQGPIER